MGLWKGFRRKNVISVIAVLLILNIWMNSKGSIGLNYNWIRSFGYSKGKGVISDAALSRGNEYSNKPQTISTIGELTARAQTTTGYHHTTALGITKNNYFKYFVTTPYMKLRPTSAPMIKTSSIQVIKDEYKQRHPQAFIIGAGKCGTGTLRRFLAAHPQIVVPVKEEIWFYDNNYGKGETWYIKHMPFSLPNQTTLENSPGYFHNPIARDRVLKDNPKGRFIVILRDPIYRAISHYVHMITEDISGPKQNVTAKGFEMSAMRKDTVNGNRHPIEYGLYSKVLRIWLTKITLRSLCIIDGTDFARNPLPHLQRIEKFLGITPYYDESKIVFDEKKGFHCLRRKLDGTADCMPTTKGRAHPNINQTVIKKLREFYKPYNEDLYRLMGQRFNWQ